MNRRALPLALFALCAACQGATSAPGVVPADLRDVERTGEGLVSTTFGPYPGRTPAWDRAGMVLSILKTVWTRAKTANPGLPAAPTSQLDAAVLELSAAIVGKNQRRAAYAANAVGLAVPDIFDSFHPDAPKQIVRMDAVYRQLGLDAHFGDTQAVASDLTSLEGDWAAARDAVHTRVPTCHRVGGTATVEGEIDASLKNTRMTQSMAEVESENGALEIDTLELLFDCPADGVVPSTGLGKRCHAQGECDPGQVCDTNNAGGTCAPDPAHAAIGTPCSSTVDCGTDPRSACNNASGDGYPGGYCTMEPCNDVQVCPPGATCVALGGETTACFQTCKNDADCRGAEGYVCQLFVTAPPTGFGPSDHACAFPCKRDSDCKQPLSCDVANGKCRP